MRKRLLKPLGPMRLCIAIVVCMASVGCIDPADRRPGLWLSGETSDEEITDWSFANDYPEIFIETQTPYLLPHSTTIACASDGTVLYVAARDPSTKRWVSNVARDGDVRLQIGETVYEQRLVEIDGDAGKRAAYRAYASKYGWPDVPAADAPEMAYYRVVARR